MKNTTWACNAVLCISNYTVSNKSWRWNQLIYTSALEIINCVSPPLKTMQSRATLTLLDMFFSDRYSS